MAVFTSSIRQRTGSSSRDSKVTYPAQRDGIIRARRATARRALTLLELTFVVAVLGIFATMAVTRFDFNALANTGARGFARRLALDLLQAQRRSISTGDNHYIRFRTKKGSIAEYALYRSATGKNILVDAPRTTPDHVAVRSSHKQCEYAFEGIALANYVITVAGPDRSWKVEVTPATGSVQVTEIE